MNLRTYAMLSNVRSPSSRYGQSFFQLAFPFFTRVLTRLIILGSATVIFKYGLFWFPWKRNMFSLIVICTECMIGENWLNCFWHSLSR